MRDGPQYSAGGTPYLCQMVMRRCRDIDGWPGTRRGWRTGDKGNRRAQALPCQGLAMKKAGISGFASL